MARRNLRDAAMDVVFPTPGRIEFRRERSPAATTVLVVARRPCLPAGGRLAPPPPKPDLIGPEQSS
jgi:hypothetical protein